MIFWMIAERWRIEMVRENSGVRLALGTVICAYHEHNSKGDGMMYDPRR